MPRPAKAEKAARAENTALLVEIGSRVRNERAKRGATRKMLAAQCQTSERYLAQIELGEANPSVLVLDSIARALDLDPVELMPAGRNRDIRHALGAPHRARRIALIGLRGAGKSTLGLALAKQLDAPFIEIERTRDRVEHQHARIGFAELDLREVALGRLALGGQHLARRTALGALFAHPQSDLDQ